MAIRSRDDPASLRATTLRTPGICVLASQELHRVLTQQGVNNMFQPGRRFFGLSTLLVLGMLLLPHLSPAQSTVISNDPNFTPSALNRELSFPDGVVFRPPTGDLLVSQSGNNQISTVDATSGMVHSFATTSAAPDKIAVRASDGMVAVMTGTFGPVAFFSSTGISQGTANLGAAIIAAFP